jgi:hypothetical protein
MNAFLEGIFDPYGRKARLYPAFLALLPAFAMIAMFTNLLELKPSSAIWAIVASASLFALADFTRQLGKSVERKLLPKWGGFPSKTLLRHVDDEIDPVTTERYHRAAEKLINGLKIPSPQEETENPLGADNAYESISKLLLPKTRDKNQFSLLFNENVNYGFRRNMLGLKPLSLVIIAITIIVLAYMDWPILSSGSLPSETAIGLFISFVLLAVFWIFFVSADRVRAAAIDYAKQLLMSLDVLES